MTIKASEIAAAVAALQAAKNYIALNCAGAESDLLICQIIDASTDLEFALKKIDVEIRSEST